MAATESSRWQRIATKLGEVIPQSRLHPAVVDAAQAVKRRRWVVAVSGGCDSVALVLLIWAHWPERRSRMVVAHFNHRLRGRSAATDARFCRSLATGLGVEYEAATWAKPVKFPSEAETREVRNGFLEGVRKRYRAQVVWTGHQKDDVAETMLMRLARGSGSAGLAAPRPIQDWGRGHARWRPLLTLSREELVEGLTAAGGRWREDASNQERTYFRNRVRQTVISAWMAAAERDAVSGAALTRELLEEDDRALEEWVDELEVLNEDGSLNLLALRGKAQALWRRGLRRWLVLQAEGSDLSRQGFEVLLEQAREGRTSRFSLGKNGFARIRRGRLYFEKLS
ncbi:MAG: tRNA lysidine(34) synthetase TilS [Candidatus Synoicihabitans palmerolidicus]|nr:tRNA lysidine(34) synthetase TilS [Candidatus Synoicihabitans palmerolidicus]